MKAVCKKEVLQKALEIAVRIASRHHTLPVLQGVYLEAKANVLEIRATNLEIGLIIKIPADITEEGVTTVSAQTLLQTISLLSNSTLTLTLSGESLLVESDRSKSKLKVFTTLDFPTISRVEGKGVVVDGTQLSYGIKSVVFAASQSAIKPELGAVYLYQRKPHSITLVATDSFRLAEKTISTDTLTLEHGVLIPQKNALEIARTIDATGESPSVVITENQIAFTFPSGVYLVSRLIEGNFPDYEQIIPKEYQAHAVVLLKDFEHALRKTNIFTNKFMQVSLDVKLNDHSIIFKSENAEAGMTEEGVRAAGEGSELLLSFNQQYLMESLGHISADSIDISFGGIGRPMVVTGHDDKNFRYLVMPMNK